MCIQQGHTFLINNQKPGSQNCIGYTTDKIELEQIVTFENNDIGINFVPSWDVQVGSSIVTFSANAYNITNLGTETYVHTILSPSVGNYKIIKSYGSVSGYPQCTPSIYTYGCDSVTVSSAGNVPNCKYTIRDN
jgi:hypothetical protein